NKINVDIDYSNIMVLYDMDNQQKAIEYAAKLRLEGKNVELVRQSTKHTTDEYICYAQKMNIMAVVKVLRQMILNPYMEIYSFG
ncbi:MAG: hypothetical protein J6A25_04505, partial [Lachnospiraceae bacterium]|nr:hypothetical protein [Lachnospiraceae bacterium]